MKTIVTIDADHEFPLDVVIRHQDYGRALESCGATVTLGEVAQQACAEIRADSDKPIFSIPADASIRQVGSGGLVLGRFIFELRQVVKLDESGETGTVIGRAEYTNARNSYSVRYRAADGRQVESWWSEDAISAA